MSLKVSVITAVRNAAQGLAATLDSVQRQSARPIEQIVVDGASTDGSLDVIRRHGERIAQLISEPDSGIYDAFNKGLALATGDVIAYLNAGDTYLSDQVIARVQHYFEQCDVDAVSGDVLIVDPHNHERVVRHYRSGKFTPERLAYGFMPAHPALFLRRSVYDRVGGYDPSYRQCGDFEFCVRAFLRQRISYVHVAEDMVRMPAGGISNRGLRSKLLNSREMLRACRRHGVPTSYLRLSMRLPIKSLDALAARWRRTIHPRVC